MNIDHESLNYNLYAGRALATTHCVKNEGMRFPYPADGCPNLEAGGISQHVKGARTYEDCLLWCVEHIECTGFNFIWTHPHNAATYDNCNVKSGDTSSDACALLSYSDMHATPMTKACRRQFFVEQRSGGGPDDLLEAQVTAEAKCTRRHRHNYPPIDTGVSPEAGLRTFGECFRKCVRDELCVGLVWRHWLQRFEDNCYLLRKGGWDARQVVASAQHDALEMTAACREAFRNSPAVTADVGGQAAEQAFDLAGAGQGKVYGHGLDQTLRACLRHENCEIVQGQAFNRLEDNYFRHKQLAGGARGFYQRGGTSGHFKAKDAHQAHADIASDWEFTFVKSTAIQVLRHHAAFGARGENMFISPSMNTFRWSYWGTECYWDNSAHAPAAYIHNLEQGRAAAAASEVEKRGIDIRECGNLCLHSGAEWMEIARVGGWEQPHWSTSPTSTVEFYFRCRCWASDLEMNRRLREMRERQGGNCKVKNREQDGSWAYILKKRDHDAREIHGAASQIAPQTHESGTASFAASYVTPDNRESIYNMVIGRSIYVYIDDQQSVVTEAGLLLILGFNINGV